MRIFEVSASEVKTTFQFHDELNEKLWDHYKLKPDVSKALKKIADTFIEYLEIDKGAITDIIITGSNCNFNFNPLSDIDLHVVIDFEKLGITPEEFVEKYFKVAKTLWNEQHDVTIYGYDVELYAQDAKEEHVSTGTYSIRKDKWIHKPKKIKPDINDISVKVKAAEIMTMIDELESSRADDPDAIDELKERIRKMRRESLHAGGEFSIGNLVFKTLRNSGYLGKLSNFKQKTIDRSLSLE